MRRIFTPQDIRLAIDLYNAGKQQWEIAEILYCKQTTISSMLRRKGIKTRIGKKIIYTDVNTTFFKEINSEANAYFLGFLYADGCIQIKDTRYQVTLKLKSNDQVIIEKFRDIMSPSSTIKITEGKYSYFRVNQKEICEQLIALGCVPNKSLILEFPTQVPKELVRHFLRGYSDGDGCIYTNHVKNKSGKRYDNIIWKIISTKQFCQETAQILKNELGVSCNQSLSKPKKNKITTTLSVGGNNQTEKVLDWLYQDATIYLPRKHQKYLEFKEHKLSQPYTEFKKLNLSPDSKDQIIKLYNEGMASNKIAKIFGVSKPSILKVLHNSDIKMRSKGIQSTLLETSSSKSSNGT